MAYLLALMGIFSAPGDWDGGDFLGVMFLSSLVIPILIAGVFLVIIFMHLNMKKDILSINMNAMFWTYTIISGAVSAILGAIIMNQKPVDAQKGIEAVVFIVSALLNMLTTGLIFWIGGMIVSDYLRGIFEGLFPRPGHKD
ncbi:MAG: hypothetical protein PHV91_01265 [Bacteroidales bacterium]|jgi:vacuolar-type H+-ATPase subunit I/STV1|nr:hypothetical protein [Candidatus Cloacimonadota bacterium]MCB5269261.1 hypothetical protein [Candidatus Cloacimonadota bacterium]MDD3299449.1 hypothetical protein [Bacteroidales bacterium]